MTNKEITERLHEHDIVFAQIGKTIEAALESDNKNIALFKDINTKLDKMQQEINEWKELCQTITEVLKDFSADYKRFKDSIEGSGCEDKN